MYRTRLSINRSICYFKVSVKVMKRELSERNTSKLGWGIERVSIWVMKDL
jgi:hypothetical protein